MKNIFLAILFVTGVSATITAHPKNQTDENYYHEFEEGATSRLLADNVNVRETASKTGTVLVNIPIGTDVTILKKAKEKMTADGFTSNWYKIQFKHNNKDQSGYVWGGLIADDWQPAEDDFGLFYLYGVSSYDNSKASSGENGLKLQVRACKNRKEVSRIVFDAAGGLDVWHSMSVTGGRGISTIKNLISFEENEHMSGGVAAKSVIVWDGQKLIYATKLTQLSDGPIYASDDLIFPEDEEGKNGVIIREKIVEEIDEDGESTINSHVKTEYIWTGTGLKKK